MILNAIFSAPLSTFNSSNFSPSLSVTALANDTIRAHNSRGRRARMESL